MAELTEGEKLILKNALESGTIRRRTYLALMRGYAPHKKQPKLSLTYISDEDLLKVRMIGVHSLEEIRRVIPRVSDGFSNYDVTIEISGIRAPDGDIALKKCNMLLNILRQPGPIAFDKADITAIVNRDIVNEQEVPGAETEQTEAIHISP